MKKKELRYELFQLWIGVYSFMLSCALLLLTSLIFILEESYVPDKFLWFGDESYDDTSFSVCGS